MKRFSILMCTFLCTLSLFIINISATEEPSFSFNTHCLVYDHSNGRPTFDGTYSGGWNINVTSRSGYNAECSQVYLLYNPNEIDLTSLTINYSKSSDSDHINISIKGFDTIQTINTTFSSQNYSKTYVNEVSSSSYTFNNFSNSYNYKYIYIFISDFFYCENLGSYNFQESYISSIESNITNYTDATQLPSTTLELHGNMLVWTYPLNQIDNVSNFTIWYTINSNTRTWETVSTNNATAIHYDQENNANSYLYFTKDIQGIGSYEVVVNPISNDYLSYTTNTVNYYGNSATQLSVPIITDLTNGKITWLGIQNASYYIIYRNGVQYRTVTGTNFQTWENGTYQVQACNNEQGYASSNKSQEEYITYWTVAPVDEPTVPDTPVAPDNANIIEWIKYIGDLIEYFFNSIFTGIYNLLSAGINSLSSLITYTNSFISAIGGLFSWLPTEIYSLLIGVLSISFIFAIYRSFKK